MRKTFMGRLLSLIAFVGICVVAAGFFINSSLDKFYKTAVETTAVITDIEELKIIPNTYKVYVEHELEGEDYKGLLSYYDEEMQEGDSIVVKYDPEKPYSIRTGSGKEYSAAYQMITWGIVIAVVAVILNIIRAVGRKKREEKRIEKKILKKQEQKARNSEYDEYDED